ncbi:hypothetical protein Tco_0925765 [Tanacetum coccineum]|uniref:CCHC-type domain-containing protein n=1 Tax=Tanacetum coccineum TaxID=301880 RepID=A0ABQ5D7T1_9ASTR
MATMAENVIAAGSENRPPMLEKGIDIKAVNTTVTRPQKVELPVDIYTLINHYQTAKETCDRVKELMEGTIMTKQERESMIYDEFDKFTSEPGESIHSYYLRYAKLINDMNKIPMSMSPMQINTKFVNHLQPEWSRFVTAAKQARNLHSVNFDQFYVPIVVSQQPPTFQPHSGFVAPTFLPTDDPIASLNKAMIFLSNAYSSTFPPTNNQLQTLSNPRTQATIQNVQVMVQNVQGRQSQGYAGSAGNNQATGARVVNTIRNAWTNQPRVIRCYNCKGEVHIAKQCTTKKANSLEENYECEDIQLQATTNFKADHVDAYDSDCDDKATENAIFMANMYPVGSINGYTVEPRYDSDILSESYDELTSNNNVISYADYMVTVGNDANNYVPLPMQKNDMILSVIEQMKSQVEKCNLVNQEKQSVNKSLTSELEQYKERIKTLENESKNFASDREKILDRGLRTVICDRNRKVTDFENQVFSQQKQMKDLTNQNNIPVKENRVNTIQSCNIEELQSSFTLVNDFGFNATLELKKVDIRTSSTDSSVAEKVDTETSSTDSSEA